jgi:lipopolysaccharide export system protein LptA
MAQKKPAQKKPPIYLKSSDRGYGMKLNGADIHKVYNGFFELQNSTLRADSAIVYLATNIIDAFGHVVITQGDTLHVYSDKLNYNDATKIALLTDHVKLVDKDATLTTNILNYNTSTKYGTYVDGGKLVNKDNTLVSKNGYYSAITRDAFFRYDVVMTSPNALIKTDTMRYNSGSRITYFYGPTHIYGKKDKDTLYTENGTYNTKTEQAFFGKKNRYSQGTKSLKGDSLFYDKLKGYGKAIKHITFEDTEQKTIIKGNLGEYYKAEDRAVITQNPYVIFVTEEKDSTKTDTVSKMASLPQKQDDVKGAIKTATTAAKNAKLDNPQVSIPKNISAGKADSLAKTIAAMPAVKNTMPVITDKQKDSVKNIAISKTANLAAPKNTRVVTPPATAKSTTPLAKTAKPTVTDSLHAGKPALAVKDSARRVKRDTMYIGADTLETQIVTYKFLKDLQEQRRLAGIRDTGAVPRKPFVPYTKATMPKFLIREMPQMIVDPPTFKDRPLFTKVKATADSTKKSTGTKVAGAKEAPVKISLNEKDKNVKATDKTPTIADKNKKPDLKPGTNKPILGKAKMRADSLKADSIAKIGKPKLSDTSRIRILSAHHNVHIFKSDLQGKSDSLFYSSSDSIIRSFVKPMYWTQGTQLSGDTIYMEMKNKKLDNMDVFPSALIVYIEKGDSTHFNQMAGKRLRVYFKDSKISHATVRGNAETIYYKRDEKSGKVTDMQRSLSGGIDINMKKGEVANSSFTLSPEHKVFPIAKVKEDNKILKGFVWKPKERPASKEDVINPKKPIIEKPDPKKDDKSKAKAPAKGTLGKPAATKSNTGKDSVKVVNPQLKPMKKDSTTAKIDSVKKLPAVKLKQDTVAKKPR